MNAELNAMIDERERRDWGLRFLRLLQRFNVAVGCGFLVWLGMRGLHLLGVRVPDHFDTDIIVLLSAICGALLCAMVRR